MINIIVMVMVHHFILRTTLQLIKIHVYVVPTILNMYTEQKIASIFILPWECRLELVDNASMEHTDISRIRAKALT